MRPALRSFEGDMITRKTHLSELASIWGLSEEEFQSVMRTVPHIPVGEWVVMTNGAYDKFLLTLLRWGTLKEEILARSEEGGG